MDRTFPPVVSWLEYMQIDASLRTFVEAEIVRAHIELDTAKQSVAHWQRVAATLQRKLDQQKQKR